ncbi:MAG: FAD-dependent oxidoreductase [Pseudomonadota bacterium]
MKKAKVVIIGAGPAGIFAGLTLKKAGKADVLLLEKGDDINNRRRAGGILCGWGGAGAFSDGKLIISSEVGGFLHEFVEASELTALLHEADDAYIRHGVSEKTLHGGTGESARALGEEAKLAGLTFIPTRIRHIGTEHCPEVLKSMRQAFGEDEVRTGCEVENILYDADRVRGVRLASGQEIEADFVVAAPGRSGATWMRGEAARIGLTSHPNPVDIGVRVEAPAPIMKPLTDVAYEAKFIYYSRTFDDRVRTFCMNPYGEVVTESYGDITTVNGHSYKGRQTENTNFAILVSSSFTHPFNDPIGYGRYIATLANLLGDGAIVQRLGDLLSGHRSTPERIRRCLTRPTLASATPGDLSFILPYRHLQDILEMLEAMDQLAPGIFSRHTLLYGVEVKFYSNRFKLSNRLESEVEGLFIAGDGAGVTRGLLQASASGILVAREILRRAGGPVTDNC